jgi:hypothetical protein
MHAGILSPCISGRPEIAQEGERAGGIGQDSNDDSSFAVVGEQSGLPQNGRIRRATFQSSERDERSNLTMSAKTRAAGRTYRNGGTPKINTRTLATPIKARSLSAPQHNSPRIQKHDAGLITARRRVTTESDQAGLALVSPQSSAMAHRSYPGTTAFSSQK